jgi:nicastrin
MGDQNIWATLHARDSAQAEDARSVIVLAARLDTTSMFDGEAPGAVSTVTGLVSALSAYQLLTQLDVPKSTKGNVMLVLFNGEAYDYIGSSRLVYDMAKKL